MLAIATAVSSIQQMRDAFEGVLAQMPMAPETPVRPTIAGGVAALVVGADPAILYLHGGNYVLGSAYGYRPLAGLALVVLLSLKAEGEAMPAGAALLCPNLDLSGAMLTPSAGPHLLDELVRMCQAYIAGHPLEDPREPPARRLDRASAPADPVRQWRPGTTRGRGAGQRRQARRR
jgi:acetyl esterase/lipase